MGDRNRRISALQGKSLHRGRGEKGGKKKGNRKIYERPGTREGEIYFKYLNEGLRSDGKGLGV